MKQCTAYDGEQRCPDQARYVADLSRNNDGGPDYQFSCQKSDHRMSLFETFGRDKVSILPWPVTSERLAEIGETWEHPAEPGYSDADGVSQDECDIADLLGEIERLTRGKK